MDTIKEVSVLVLMIIMFMVGWYVSLGQWEKLTNSEYSELFQAKKFCELNLPRTHSCKLTFTVTENNS